jgi:glycosyltransferase involved in cell wall biosynthesis
MHVVHLMASPFYGGPERQMLGLARHLPESFQSTFLSFAEGGKACAFLEHVHHAGLRGKVLKKNWPHLGAAIAEVASELRDLRADLLCCSGYKPDIVGWRAARKAGVPVIAVAHGWTAATWKVRCYEGFDRVALRWFDAIVCVSEAQARRVRYALVRKDKIVVIHNAVGIESFRRLDPKAGEQLRALFPEPPRWIIGGAGRLSPEKGFHILVDAAAEVLHQRSDAGFVLFGDGPLRQDLEMRAKSQSLERRFIFTGFRPDLLRYLPHLDLGVIPSFTEGLPVILLELFAAGVPAVATRVGGVPEVLEDGLSGYLVRVGDSKALAAKILEMLGNDGRRRSMGQHARERVQADFSFTRQSGRYQQLFARFGGPIPSTGD